MDQETDRPASNREGTALCLSGGGFRAALFHLGALRRLNELGILSQVTTISAVSGGSLLAAHLVTRVHTWPSPGEPIADWERDVAAPFRAIARRNLRTGPILRRALPWNWFRSETAIEALADLLDREIGPMRLSDLPERPAVIFYATDLGFGTNWIMTRDRIGDFRAGYMAPGQDWTVARAVAASACFPPVFGPMRLHLDPAQLRGGSYRGPDRDRLAAGIQLTDGGVYDNMALEPVWKSHRTVLVSDGGAIFGYAARRSFVRQLLRYAAVIGNQAAALRRRWLVAGFQNATLSGAYWGIGTSAAGYSPAFVSEVISRIRTDFDAFSPIEIGVLENHGYLVADHVISRHALDPGVTTVTPQVPHPHLRNEVALRPALAGSDRRTWLGRRQSARRQA